MKTRSNIRKGRSSSTKKRPRGKRQSRRSKDKDGSEDTNHCTGALIKENWIITAANCFDVSQIFFTLTAKDLPSKRLHSCLLYSFCFFFLQGFDEDSFQLVFGKNDNIQQRLIKNVTKHPKYKEDSLDFNIALLGVDPPVVYDNEVRRIDLPCGNSGK